MKFLVIPVTPFQQNCTLVWCTETHCAAVIDPGGDIEQIKAAVKDKGLKIEKILLTHGHIDHVGGAASLALYYQAPIEGPHRDDAFWLDQLPQQSQMFNFPSVDVFEPSRWLNEGDVVRIGKGALHVSHCPGHTPGHVVFYDEVSGTAQVGDVLFQGSIGRTDFPKGSYEQLMHSIRTKLLIFKDDVCLISGHGPQTTIGLERRTNPFIAER